MMRLSVALVALCLQACQSAPHESPRHGQTERPQIEGRPQDRIDEIVSRMNGWRIDPVGASPRMVLMPYEDYRLLVEQARDQRNWARSLEDQLSGAQKREPGLGR